MEANNKSKFDSSNLLVEFSETVEAALKKAIREAILKHKQAKNPIAVWRGEKVVLIEPDEILADSALSEVRDNKEDNVYAELLEK